MLEMLYANSIIHRGIKEKNPVTQLHLHKLTYIVQGYCLCKKKGGLGEDIFQPWPMGPVMDNVYYRLRHFGSKPITDYCYQFDPDTIKESAKIVREENTDFYTILDEVWDKYRHIDVYELIDFTHKPGGGWDKARKTRSIFIKNDDIKDEFTDVINQEGSNN